MERLELRLGHWTVRYFPSGERNELADPIDNLRPPEDARLVPHPRRRPIVLRYLPHWSPTVQYLNWSNGEDQADELVTAEPAGEQDFGGTPPAEAVDLRCRECGVSSRVLVASPGVPLSRTSQTH